MNVILWLNMQNVKTKVLIRSGSKISEAAVCSLNVNVGLFRHFDVARGCYWQSPSATWDVGIVAPRRSDVESVQIALRGILKGR